MTDGKQTRTEKPICRWYKDCPTVATINALLLPATEEILARLTKRYCNHAQPNAPDFCPTAKRLVENQETIGNLGSMLDSYRS